MCTYVYISYIIPFSRFHCMMTRNVSSSAKCKVYRSGRWCSRVFGGLTVWGFQGECGQWPIRVMTRSKTAETRRDRHLRIAWMTRGPREITADSKCTLLPATRKGEQVLAVGCTLNSLWSPSDHGSFSLPASVCRFKFAWQVAALHWLQAVLPVPLFSRQIRLFLQVNCELKFRASGNSAFYLYWVKFHSFFSKLPIFSIRFISNYSCITIIFKFVANFLRLIKFNLKIYNI